MASVYQVGRRNMIGAIAVAIKMTTENSRGIICELVLYFTIHPSPPPLPDSILDSSFHFPHPTLLATP